MSDTNTNPFYSLKPKRTARDLVKQRQGEPKLIAVPMTLPMGRKESPPAFSANTETVTDLANNDLKTIGAAAFDPGPASSS